MKSNFLKKALTIAVAAVMTLGSIATVVSAAESPDVTVNINDSSVVKEAGLTQSGNTYTAYKIFTATREDTGRVNEEDGTPVYAYTYALNSAFQGFFDDVNNPYSLNADNEILLNGEPLGGDTRWDNVNDTNAAAFAAAIEKYAIVNKIGGTQITAGTAASLQIGYYVISQTSVAKNDEDALKAAVASKPILANITENTNITVKDDYITLEKKIVEGDDKVDTNTASVGDTINYEVTTRIPSYSAIANVDKTTLTFELTDTFDSGITFDGVGKLTVSIDGAAVTEGITKTATGNGFVVKFDADTIWDNQGADVTLTYSGTLNANAVVNSAAGNPNKIELKYTTNPNNGGSYDTLDDDVKTFTYGFKIHKVDKNDIYDDLAGAQFEIKDADGKVVAVVTYDEEGNPQVVSGDSSDVKVTTGEDGTVIVSGIKGEEGGSTYTITEKVAPEGYSLIANPITVVITGNKDEGSDDYNGTATITVTQTVLHTDEQREKEEYSQESKPEATSLTTKPDGTIDINVLVEDTKGISLPETGSREALFCMIGGVLIVLIGLLYYEFAVRRKKA